MRQFARLNSDWHGMAWHWYPLGAGKSDDVIPNVNDPNFTNTIVRERLEEILFWRDRDVPGRGFQYLILKLQYVPEMGKLTV